MNKKTLLSLMMLCFAFFGVVRADVVEIGEQTGPNSYLPTYSWYKYSLTQQIYTASEVGEAGTITKIAFKVANSKSTGRDINIYLSHTSESSFSGTSGWIAQSTSYLVFSGNVDFLASGWTTITLDSPFEYNGTSNLLLTIDDNTGSYVNSSSNSPTFYVYSAFSNTAIYKYNDNTNYNPEDSSNSSGTLLDVKNCIQLDITPSGGTFCPAPSNLTVTNATGNTATLSWTERGNADTWVITYMQGDPQLGGTHYVEANENPFTLTNLTPNTTCTAWVRAFCDGDELSSESNFVSFTPADSYFITVSANLADAGTVSGGGEYSYGDTCTLTATPNIGYYLYSWMKDDVMIGDYYQDEYTFTVTESANIVANFQQIEYYPYITSMPEGGGWGEIVGLDYATSGAIHYGDAVTLRAIPNEDFRFYKWTMWVGTDNDYYEIDLSTDTLYTFTFDENFVGFDAGNQGEIEFVANFVESIGDCVRPLDLTATEVGPTSATLSWTELGTSQAWMMYYRPAFTPAYVPYDSLEIYQNPYTLTGLQPNTAYEAYIVPSCGFTDGIANEYLASNTIEFTTLEACPTPFNVQVNNITSNSASVTWTGYSDSYTMDYRVATELLDTIFSEDFEGGEMPQGWNNEGAASWIIGVGDYTSDSIGAHNGNYNAKITHGESSDQTYLVTPALDLSDQNNLALSFWYINRSWGGDIDELGVYYRIGEQGVWNELWSTSVAHETWTNQIIELTNLADNYQIGFLFTDHYGYGVGLDDIIVATEVVSEWVTIDNVTSPLALTDLTPNTNYEVRVQGLCGDTITNWSNSAFFTTAEAQSYTITVLANPTDGGTVSGGGTINHGQTCSLTATANTGYTFVNWTENGSVVSTTPNYSFTVTGARTLVANFSLNSYTITATANPTGGGTVSGSGTYNHGAPVTLTATPNAGYTFLNWTKNGQVVSSNTTYTFTASGAGTYVANFQQIEYYPWFTVLPENGGSAEIQGDGIVHYGDQVTIIATPNTGYDFVNWTTENFESAQALYLSNQATYTFTMDNSHLLTELYPDGGEIQIFANFELQSFEITVMAEEGGTVTGSSTGTYAYGDTLHLNAVANQGYTFTNWTKNGTVVSTTANSDFVVTETATYVAHFSTNAYQITASTNPTGAGTISGTGEYNYGASCTLTVTPNEGYTFVNWTKDGQVVGTSTSITFTVTGDADYVANFNTNSYEITTSTNPTGAGTVTGTGEYNYGASCTLTVTPNEGYTFVNWTKDGQVVGTSTSITFTVTGDADYVANFNTNSYEITASTNPNGAGTISGTGEYNYGASCTLTVTPNEGYTFVNWTKDGQVVGTSTSITFTVTGDADYVANFNTNTYEITASTNPTGAGTVTGAGEYNYGASCTLTVTPNEGYTFANWTLNGTVVGTNPTITFTVFGSAAYVANFSVNSYEITASANPTAGGTVTGANTYNFGEQATLTANANTGYTFINWTENGNVVSISPTYSFTVEGPRTLVANFQLNSYEITASANPTAGGTVTGANTYNFGEQATLTANANTGYTFVNWTENGNVVSTSPTYSFTVEGPRTLVANFQLNSYEITASANPTAGGSVTGGGTYNHFETCTLTATANTGYTFINWTKDGVQVSTTASISFVVSESADYVANFQLNSYEITAMANPTAGGTVSGTNTYDYGSTCTLIATESEGYTFTSWTENGNVVSTSPTLSFTVEGPRTLVANFQLNSYEITATANPTAGGSVTGGGTYNHFETCTLIATESEGYTFIDWTENGNLVSTSPTFSFTVEGPRTLVANFQLNSYQITATANPTEGGTLTGGGTYNYFETCTLSAAANTGYTFVNWTKDGEVVSYNSSVSFTVIEDASYVANFQLNSYQITATANPTEGGTLTGGGTYNHFETCTLIATESVGYTFTSWTENGNVVSTSPTFSFTVEGPRTLVANFQLNSYAINASANPTAGGSVTGGGTYDHFETCTLIATESVGYTFIDWTENGNVVSTSPTFSFTVEGPRTLVANFQLNSYAITASANPTAGGSVTGSGTYDHFETCTLIATESVGYTFTSWTENGSMVSTSPTFSFTVEGPRTLVANFQLNSYTITASANPTSGGSVTGGGTYNHFETCTLIATPSEHYNFDNWTKNGVVVSTSATYSFTVTEGATYVAHFSRVTYQITAVANPTEGGNVSGTGTYSHGSICTLTAIANTGYAFSSWTKDGVVVSSNPSYSFSVTENATYVANFNLNMYTVSVSADPTAGGSVSGGGTFLYGESSTVSAMPNAGYTFTNWTKNGTVVSTEAIYTFTVTEDASLVAHFSLDHYTITVSVDPEAVGTATGGGSFTYGETCNLTATANTGYAFVNWTKDGTVVSSNANYSFTVTGNGDYVAHFAVARYTLTVLAEPAEGGNVYGGGTYDFGHVVTLRAIAHEGYEFDNWTKDGAVIATTPNHPVVVREDAEYVAHFHVTTFEIKANTYPDNTGVIEGIGFYNYGETCTLTVTPNNGYEFLNWTLNGQVVSEEASFSFIVTESLDFVAYLQADGVVEQGGVTVALYPNPAKRRLTIEASEPVNVLEIYNINGALVYRQNDCSDKVEINVETYAPGTYMIRLTTDSTVETRRFVKE